MKITLGALAAVLLAAVSWSGPAQAQGLPQGSYLRSCSNIGFSGDGLVATCRSTDGREQRSVMRDFRHCVGDIGNNNGVLQCQQANGRQAFGQIINEPGRGREPGYGAPRYGEAPGYGYGSDRRAGGEAWERCRGLQRESEELRHRIDREWNPLDRSRMEGRLRELRAEQERCR